MAAIICPNNIDFDVLEFFLKINIYIYNARKTRAKLSR